MHRRYSIITPTTKRKIGWFFPPPPPPSSYHFNKSFHIIYKAGVVIEEEGTRKANAVPASRSAGSEQGEILAGVGGSLGKGLLLKRLHPPLIHKARCRAASAGQQRGRLFCPSSSIGEARRGYSCLWFFKKIVFAGPKVPALR